MNVIFIKIRRIVQDFWHFGFGNPLQQFIIQAFATSKLDYCNCLFYEAPAFLLYRLQKAPFLIDDSYAARIITHVWKRDHISPTLAELHWLPIKQRIDYKTLLYVYKTLNVLAPAYRLNSLYNTSWGRTWGPLVNITLIPHCTLTKTYGDRAFMSASLRLCSDLLEDIRVPNPLKLSRPIPRPTYLQAFYRWTAIFPLGFP